MKKLICAVTVLAVSTAQAGTILFVDEDAPPNGDGLSWNTAFRYLQDALVHASVPAHGGNEVRVAQGLHLPDRHEANPSATRARRASAPAPTNAAPAAAPGAAESCAPSCPTPAACTNCCSPT